MTDRELLLERLQMLSDEINRIFVILEQHTEWVNPDRSLEDDLYLEMAAAKRDASAYITRAMEHLLKLKYCTNNRYYNKWLNEVDSFIRSYEDTCGENQNIINEIAGSMDTLYSKAIKYYKHDANDYKDLSNNVDCIPNDYCPWTLDELIRLSIWDLITILPDPDELNCQMQLYPEICAYNEDGREIGNGIRSMQCSDCAFYPKCIATYYERR